MLNRVARRRTGGWRLAGVVIAGISLMTACSGGSSDNEASFSDINVGDVSEASTELSARLRDEGLTTFASALDVIDVGQLIDTPNFTLLVPSDDAFQAMDADEIGDLLADPASLLAVLQNHVIDEQLLVADITAMSALPTRAGLELAVADTDGELTIGGATVSTSDLAVENGIVHVVDKVLVP